MFSRLKAHRQGLQPVHAYKASTVTLVHESLLSLSCSLRCSLASVMQVPGFLPGAAPKQTDGAGPDPNFSQEHPQHFLCIICKPVDTGPLGGMAHAVLQP